MKIEKSTTAKIAAVVAYLTNSLSLFYLGANKLITQEVYVVGIATTVIVLFIIVAIINREAAKRTKPEPSKLEKY
jgi:beta-lactamase regulating signal transducer with metallopeptidase domain